MVHFYQSLVYRVYQLINLEVLIFIFIVSDPRVNGWPMMSSPLPTLIICVLYAYFSKTVGPKLMENRKPFNLRNTLIIYNFIQTVFSAWIFYEVTECLLATTLLFDIKFLQYLMSGWWGSYSFRCQPVDYSNNPIALRVSLWYFYLIFCFLVAVMFFSISRSLCSLFIASNNYIAF